MEHAISKKEKRKEKKEKLENGKIVKKKMREKKRERIPKPVKIYIFTRKI